MLEATKSYFNTRACIIYNCNFRLALHIFNRFKILVKFFQIKFSLQVIKSKLTWVRLSLFHSFVNRCKLQVERGVIRSLQATEQNNIFFFFFPRSFPMVLLPALHTRVINKRVNKSQQRCKTQSHCKKIQSQALINSMFFRTCLAKKENSCFNEYPQNKYVVGV